ncbi:MAG: AAA family ATPase [archaeon]
MIVIAASVTGDTPVLVRNKGVIQLIPIGELIDSYYADGEEGVQKDVIGLEVLGMQKLATKYDMSKTYFGGSKFQPVKGVFRHKANEIYEIEFNGGKVRTTGNHSVFIRSRNGIQAKRVDELCLDDVLVDLPYKVNRTNSKMEVRAHTFTPLQSPIRLPVYDKIIQEAYAQVMANTVSPHQASLQTGLHVTTVYGWKKQSREPHFYRYHEEGIPNEVTVTPELMKLFGYYTAEGYARWELDFCFGTHETEFIEDVQHSMKTIFGVEADSVIYKDNRCNIVYQKKPLADFFSKYFGKGAHNKSLPSFIYELPKEYFLSFLKAYIDGDGYEDKANRLEATSVSKKLIMELDWLCKMHGIKSYTGQFIAKEGRRIKNGEPLKETIAYRLGIGSTNNPFLSFKKTPAQGLARIKKITKQPFDEYVYDLCGCEEEAFFGGETPILLHNTNRVNSIDEALRRPGRFDREIEIGVPDKAGRLEILQIHTRGMPLCKEGVQSVDLDHFAGITYGFVGADLTALGKESAMKALRRYLPEINLQEEQIPESVLERMEVQKRDFEDALKEIQPSALREVMVEIPNVKWDDIGSLDDVKAELKQAVEWPLKYPTAFTEMGIRPPRGVMLYGPPGTGKTLLAKAIATESQANFISIKGPELISKWVGESEKGIRQVFKKARQVAPVVVFFDEIDAIASMRGSGSGDSGVGERVVNQLLTELDGAESLKDVVFIAATNRPDLIDPGLMRPGRIDKIIEVKVPDEKAREAILKVHTRGVPLVKGISLADLAKRTPGFSGADLNNLVREAALLALQESDMKPTPITKKHFDSVLAKVTSSIPAEAAEAYAEYKQSKSPEGFKPNYVR